MKKIKDIGRVPLAIITAVVVGVFAFYLGFRSGGQNSLNLPNQDARNFQGRVVGMMGGAYSGQNRMMGNLRGGGFVGGEIISLDDKSITVKLRDGGSRIVFVSSSTQVLKSTAGSMSDLVSGGQVTVMGSQNPDGSITAQSVQVR